MLSRCAITVLLVSNPRPKGVLQPIANSSLIYSKKSKVKSCNMKCRSLNRGSEEANSWHEICPVVQLGKTTPTICWWRTQSKVLLLSHQVSFGDTLTCHRDNSIKAYLSSRSLWPRFLLKSFSTKGGVSTSLAQCGGHRSTPSRRVEDVLRSHQDSKDGQRTKIQEWFTLEPAHKAQYLTLSLT